MTENHCVITDSLFEAFVQCKYKSHLRTSTAIEQISDFEIHHTSMDMAYRDLAQSRLLATRLDQDAVSSSCADSLILGKPLLLNVTVETNRLHACVDAVARVDTPSHLGDFSYHPIQYCRDEQIPQAAKLLLGYRSIVIGDTQEALPSHGTIIHGAALHSKRLKLQALQDKVRRLLGELRAQVDAGVDTRLVLNQHCAICGFQSHCRKEAIKTDNLSLLRGITKREVLSQNQKGIFTVNQLSYTFRHRKASKRAKHPANPHHFALQALSLRTNTVHVHGSPVLPSAEALVYYDIEGLPAARFWYLVGAAVAQNDKVEHHSFWASSKSEETAIFSQFAALVTRLPSCKLLHFGQYDTDALKHVRQELDRQHQDQVDSILENSIDVLSLVRSHIYFPTYSNSLKEIAAFLGFQWTESAASGLQSIVWRENWELSRDPSLKQRLIRYNQEDCMALKAVCDFIQLATAERSPESDIAGNLKVVNTEETRKPNPRWREYRTPDFLLEDFERASKCGHFDYQRERVFVRTDKKLARTKKRRRRKPTSLLPNKRITITCECCPQCGNGRTKSVRVLRRRVVDLKFSPRGVKRWITEYSSRRYWCPECEATFLPEGWKGRWRIYGRQLMTWCVYQNIACKQHMAKVTATLKDVFSIDIRSSQAYKFKSWVISQYDSLYDELRQRIVKSHVLHVDEGDVALRNAKGYVWVFATMDAVWYLYKDSRSGEFLKELLGSFSGVLVSDFYHAYNGVNCPQQKCLVHLLRDLNEDLQTHPFDEEFKSITVRFGAVLRSIVDSIDRYGLKKRHLRKHRRAAESFVRHVCSHSFSSEVALSYQKRFKKSGDRLFTFLDYDNVPWNNAFAEYAVKNFMRYKMMSNNLLTERSLKDALVMLSISQTCRLNGVNVLKFLLSGKTNIETILGL